jgi:hypothetical protein
VKKNSEEWAHQIHGWESFEILVQIACVAVSVDVSIFDVDGTLVRNVE